MRSAAAEARNDWCASVHDLGVVAVAEAFGLRLASPGKPRRGLTPCPACGADTRSTEHHQGDKRGAVGLTTDGLGWRCHKCGAHGDAVTLASYLAGEGGRVTAAVAAACEAKGLLGAEARARPRLVSSSPGFPPVDELADLLRACVDVQRDTETELWLHSRSLAPEVVTALRIVRALPARATEVPPWASRWARSGHRLILPVYDAEGLLRSVRARDVTGEAEVKELSPAGFDVGGLVLACSNARSLLRDGWLPTGERAAEHARRCGVVICEGSPDWLTWLCWQPDRDSAPAIFGIGSGAWRPEHAARIPDGCTVTIATHADAAGEEYALRIVASLEDRDVSVRRWRPAV